MERTRSFTTARHAKEQKKGSEDLDVLLQPWRGKKSSKILRQRAAEQNVMASGNSGWNETEIASQKRLIFSTTFRAHLLRSLLKKRWKASVEINRLITWGRVAGKKVSISGTESSSPTQAHKSHLSLKSLRIHHALRPQARHICAISENKLLSTTFCWLNSSHTSRAFTRNFNYFVRLFPPWTLSSSF